MVHNVLTFYYSQSSKTNCVYCNELHRYNSCYLFIGKLVPNCTLSARHKMQSLISYLTFWYFLADFIQKLFIFRTFVHYVQRQLRCVSHILLRSWNINIQLASTSSSQQIQYTCTLHKINRSKIKTYRVIVLNTEENYD